jgi:hypothetical protein
MPLQSELLPLFSESMPLDTILAMCTRNGILRVYAPSELPDDVRYDGICCKQIVVEALSAPRLQRGMVRDIQLVAEAIRANAAEGIPCALVRVPTWMGRVLAAATDLRLVLVDPCMLQYETSSEQVLRLTEWTPTPLEASKPEAEEKTL